MTKATNSKYVQLLEIAFEKYKSVEYICQHDEEECKSETDVISININNETQKKIVRVKNNSNQKRTHRPKIVREKPKSFLEAEDAIIKAAIKEMRGNIKNINIPSLLKQLNRSHASVEQRIKKLVLTGESGHRLKRFSLEEDMIIMDFILDKIARSGKCIESVVKFPSDIIELGPILRRTHQSVFERWKSVLLSTILGYHSKSLNLDIRIMLANYLADHFQSIISIDWTEVSKQPEFAGNTEISVRKVFHRLLYKTSKELDIDKGCVTLNQVSDYATGHKHQTKRSEKTEKRQLDIVNYFERRCKAKDLRISGVIEV